MPTCNTRPTATAEALWCTNICCCRGQNSLPERRSNIFLTLCYYGYIIINCITLLYTVDETQIKHSGELSESTNEHALFNSFLCLHVSSSHQKIMFKKNMCHFRYSGTCEIKGRGTAISWIVRENAPKTQNTDGEWNIYAFLCFQTGYIFK